MLIGTHRAEQRRPRRLGQASRAVLSANTMFRDRDAAGQSSGDMTPQPVVSACAEPDEHLTKVGFARIGQEQLGSHGRSSLAQGLGHDVEDGRFRPGHLQRRLQAGLERDSLGRCRTGSPSRSACSCSTRSACRVMKATNVPAMATPMTIDHRRSSRAAPAAAWASLAVCNEAVADAVSAGRPGSYRGSSALSLRRGQPRRLRRLRLPGQERAKGVLSCDEGGHPGRQVRRQAGLALRCHETPEGS